ncbi:MAG: DUF4037 domain-containing protein, partial [Chloroflexia bacterium]
IARALSRNDAISVNHRTAAFFASVFDIIFAVNRVQHPGEKRLAHYIATLCPLLPSDFLGNINNVLKLSGEANADILSAIDILMSGLDLLLLAEDLILIDG